jgi:hypothetical protein
LGESCLACGEASVGGPLCSWECRRRAIRMIDALGRKVRQLRTVDTDVARDIRLHAAIEAGVLQSAVWRYDTRS